MASFVDDDKVMFSRLSVGEALKRSFIVYRNRMKVFLPIGIMQALPALIVSCWMHSMANSFGGGSNAAPMNNDWVFPLIDPMNVPAVCIRLFLSYFLAMLAAGANIRATADIYAGKEPSLVACLREGLHRFCDLLLFGSILLATFILFTGIMLGIFLLAIGISILIGIFYDISDTDLAATFLLTLVSGACYSLAYLYVVISFLMAPSSIVLERKSPMEAMKRSWNLIEGTRFYVFCAIFLMSLLNSVLGLLFGLLPGLVAPLLITTIWNLFAMPVSSILGAVLFFSVRVEKEGLDREILISELMGGSVDYEHIQLTKSDEEILGVCSAATETIETV